MRIFLLAAAVVVVVVVVVLSIYIRANIPIAIADKSNRVSRIQSAICQEDNRLLFVSFLLFL